MDEAARALQEAVVTVLSHHHPRAHARMSAVREAARALGAKREKGGWPAVLAAYLTLAKQLRHHMHEEEETILERVQLFFARKELVPGALAKSRHRVLAMTEEHAEIDAARALLGELCEGADVDRTDGQERSLLDALAAFDAALAEHSGFEDRVLAPAFLLFAA